MTNLVDGVYVFPVARMRGRPREVREPEALRCLGFSSRSASERGVDRRASRAERREVQERQRAEKEAKKLGGGAATAGKPPTAKSTSSSKTEAPSAASASAQVRARLSQQHERLRGQI